MFVHRQTCAHYSHDTKDLLIFIIMNILSMPKNNQAFTLENYLASFPSL